LFPNISSNEVYVTGWKQKQVGAADVNDWYLVC